MPEKKKSVAKKSAKTINFGLHLTLDGYGGNPDKLNDGKLVKKILDELPGKVGMHKIYGPVTMDCPEFNEKDSGGHSGFVMIAESHISIHTFPARGFVSIDVYTCKNGLDNRYTVKYFKEAFDLQDTEENFVERGKKYPEHNLVP